MLPPAIEQTPDVNRTGSWMDYPGRHWVMDDWLIDRRWRNMVRMVESDTTTGLPSDHTPLIIELYLRVGGGRQNEVGDVD